MADYLRPNKFVQNIDEKRNIFKIRTNMMELGVNFKNRYKSTHCQLGCKTEENLNHILECTVTKEDKIDNCFLEQIFNGNLDNIVKNSKIIISLMNIRKKKIDEDKEKKK